MLPVLLHMLWPYVTTIINRKVFCYGHLYIGGTRVVLVHRDPFNDNSLLSINWCNVVIPAKVLPSGCLFYFRKYILSLQKLFELINQIDLYYP